MNRLTYNVALAVGLCSIGCGVYLVAGTGLALIVVGSLVLSLTLLGVVLTRKA